MEVGGGHVVGLVELALVFALALGFGVPPLLDLRRARRTREAAEREARDG
ncbi:MAG: hypothetical protein ACKOGH_21440 [Alphaproteobacteria bacterium]